MAGTIRHRHMHQHAEREIAAAVAEHEVLENALESAKHKFTGLVRRDDEEEVPKPRTITRVVYSTLEPTFTDKVVGYSTATEGLPDETPVIVSTREPAPSPSPSPSPKPSPPETTEKKPAEKQPTTLIAETTAKASPKPVPTSAASGDDEDEESLLTSIKITKVGSTSSAEPTDSADVGTNTIEATELRGNPLSQPTSSSSSTGVPTVDGGMTGGAMAGMAIGIVGGLGLLAGLIFFFVKKRKQKDNVDNEKFDSVNPGFVGAGAAVGSRSEKVMSTAPRLDVRHHTALFMPNRASQMGLSKLSGINSNTAQNPTPKSGWERPMTSDDSKAANPFRDNAGSIDSINAAGPSEINGAAGAGATLAAGAAGAAAGAASNKANAPAPIQTGPNGAVAGAIGQRPVRSTSRGGQTKFSPGQGPSPFSDAAQVGAAQGTPQTVEQTAHIPMPLAGVIEEGGPMSPKGPGSDAGSIVGVAGVTAGGVAASVQLYRVHLDFSPSMPDELRVRAGEIVRLIKEFDDGWCMCASDDLKREGVLPRTCISNRPIRRPQNGPNNGPGGPGPMGPNGQRRMSPSNGRGPGGPSMGPNGRNSPAPAQGPQYRPQQQRGPGGPGSPPMMRGPPGPMQQGPNGRNSPGPNNYGAGPQYRPQNGQGRPMSPAMGMNGQPRNGTPRSHPPNGSPLNMQMNQGLPGQAYSHNQGPPGSMTPRQQGPPTALPVGMPSAGSVAHIAATFPLPGSPTQVATPPSRKVTEAPVASQTPVRAQSPPQINIFAAPATSKPEPANIPVPMSPVVPGSPGSVNDVEYKMAVPEVIVSASPTTIQHTPSVKGRKPAVGRKPLPGQAQ